MNIISCCFGKSLPEEPVLPPTRSNSPELTFKEMMNEKKVIDVAKSNLPIKK